MALLRAKTKAKKAELESRSAAAEARRAAQDSAAAVRDLAQALLTQLKQLGIDEKTGDAVQRFKSSEAYGKAAAKASEISKLMADSEAVAARREAASQKTTAALTGLGTWLATGDRGQKLGITQQRRRRSVSWLFGLLGIGIGYAAGILTAPKQGREIREQLTSRAGSSSSGGMDNVGHIGQGWDGAMPSAERPLTEKVRTRLGEDPRTSDLPSLEVDIVGGTVVVRGTVPQGRDQGTIRDVILSVEGVDDVDLRLDSNI